jgi:hypothetical protein
VLIVSVREQAATQIIIECCNFCSCYGYSYSYG